MKFQIFIKFFNDEISVISLIPEPTIPMPLLESPEGVIISEKYSSKIDAPIVHFPSLILTTYKEKFRSTFKNDLYRGLGCYLGNLLHLDRADLW